MSATNATSNYELPIFLATDKPAWLTDWNGAMTAIDTAIHAAQAAADGAQTTASAATVDIATINASLSTITGNITSLTTAVNGNTAAINTINSLIGNGEPTTTDKTLIGAINEIYAMITGGGSTEIQAANVSYDNTSSGLTAASVQAAIDEVYASIGAGYDLDITAHMGSLTPTSIFTIYSSITELSYAMNDDYSIGKVYGGICLGNVNLTGTDWDVVATIPAITSMAAPTNEYSINIGTYATFAANPEGAMIRLTFKTNGTIDVEAKSLNAITGTVMFIPLPASLYFFEDFGD